MERFGFYFLLGALAAISCGEADTSTPRGALAAMAPCIEKRDAACLYGRLDRDSRWSLQTIHKTLGRIETLAQRSYPPDKRASALGSWSEEAAAKEPSELFRVYCEENGWMSDLTVRFGPARTVSTEVEAKRAQIITSRGGSIELSAPDGSWGLSDFREELAADKLRLLTRLARVEKNASAFEEQKRAEASPSEGETP